MKRNSNLDVFRCLAMFLIVVGHVYQHRVNIPLSMDLQIAHWLCMFLVWHVDSFLSLSGWFGIRFSISKFGRLFALIAFYSVVSILIGRFVLGAETRIAITGGWYGNTYLCLMLVAPLINAGIDGLRQQGTRALVLAWCGFATVILVNWLSGNPYISLTAYDVGPFSLVQMVFVYFTVRVVRLTDLAKRIRLWHIGLAVLVFVGGSLAIRGARANYLAPHVIAMAIAMFILFEKFVKVPAWLGRVCVWAAPSMFGVYLLHEVTSFGKVFHRVPVGWCVDFGLPAWLSILVGAAVCFAICLGIDVVRRIALNGICKYEIIRRSCEKVLKS